MEQVERERVRVELWYLDEVRIVLETLKEVGDEGEHPLFDRLLAQTEQYLRKCSGCGERGGADFWQWHFPCDYD